MHAAQLSHKGNIDESDMTLHGAETRVCKCRYTSKTNKSVALEGKNAEIYSLE